MAEFKNELILQDASGNSVSIDLRNALVLGSAPTTETKARAGMQAYVVSGGTITAEYVCTAVSGSTYTWVKREISGGGSGGVEIDTTLTQSGKAADAAVVGEKLAEISGDIAAETDPTVPAWAKQAEKPTYTASEVGARPSTWTPTASEVGALPASTTIPSKTSQLENDSGYAKQTELNQLSKEIADLETKSVKTVNGTAPDENGNVDVIANIETPKIVASVDEMTDPTKQYVLDGYIWHYKTVTVPGSETSPNLFTPAEDKLNLRLSGTSGSASSSNGSFVTDFISVMNDAGENLLVSNTPFTVRLNKVALLTGQSKVVFYNNTTRVGANILKSDTNTTVTEGTTVSDIKTQGDSSSVMPTDWSNVTNIKLQYQFGTTQLQLSDIADCEITFDAKKVVTESTTKNEFVNSGIVYSQGADAADVEALKKDVAGLKKDVEALKESGVSTPTQSGAVWYAVGDSITAGYNAANGVGADKSWVAHVIKYNGYDSVKSKNLGVAGIGFVQTAPGTTNTARTVIDSNDFSAADLVTIAIGINDWKESCDLETVKTEMSYCFGKILTDNPYCKIIFITPIDKIMVDGNGNHSAIGYEVNGITLDEFVTAQMSVCRENGIEVIDMTHSSVVNLRNMASLFWDNTHPNERCHLALGRELARKIHFA